MQQMVKTFVTSMDYINIAWLPESAQELDQQVVGMEGNGDTSDRRSSMLASDDDEAPHT